MANPKEEEALQAVVTPVGRRRRSQRKEEGTAEGGVRELLGGATSVQSLELSDSRVVYR